MEKKNYLLQVDPQLTFSVNTQIKDQLKWLIGMGQLEVGDMLPSTSHLADELELNRNTINWVYSQLRDEGLVTMQKGRGTQIAGGSRTRSLVEERKSMQRLIDDTIREASAAGMDLKSFFMAGLAYTLLQPPRPTGKLRILLVECQGHDHPFYRSRIEQATGGEVEMLFLDEGSPGDAAVREAALRCDAIVATLNHAEEAKALFARHDRKVIVIGAAVEPSLLLAIANLKQGSRVAFVCLGRIGGEWMASRIREAGIQALHTEVIGMNERERLNEAARSFDKIYASDAVYSELKNLAPGKTELFPMKLEQSSANLLEEIASQAR
ncbi:GntR family transcriptional regulator [Paenibacillus sacheonensis]|uniref:GntR family transcriptional regulator n=1 Tax=Paenibacillus sacheonensis TaxID=742054 RepID=A0A7X5C0B0_9BACL|nr:GntR family transcriptional regulator [Paenibacillus sacheonensis]MBM7566632.1 GntR family transcriptional regulator [Paenibacillus sacheonensis]NBC73548.1 GntR family transcriptional regulator [Paenibacillus sacheonensis]